MHTPTGSHTYSFCKKGGRSTDLLYTHVHNRQENTHTHTHTHTHTPFGSHVSNFVISEPRN